MNVTAVIFTYLRPEHLSLQLKAIRNQSQPPDQIIIGHLEGPETKNFDFQGLELIRFRDDPAVGMVTNFLTSLCVPLDTDWIALYDDDILPGRHWHENCLMTARDHGECAFGAFGGHISGDYYDRVFPRQLNNSNPIEVDWIGQGYFFPRDWIHWFFEEPMPSPWTSSNDLWFSYQVKKHGERCMIPPHPEGAADLYAVEENLARQDTADKKLHKRNDLHKKHRKELIKYGKSQGVWS